MPPPDDSGSEPASVYAVSVLKVLDEIIFLGSLRNLVSQKALRSIVYFIKYRRRASAGITGELGHNRKLA